MRYHPSLWELILWEHNAFWHQRNSASLHPSAYTTLPQVKKDYCEGLRDSLDLVPIGAWWGQGRKVSHAPATLSRSALGRQHLGSGVTNSQHICAFGQDYIILASPGQSQPQHILASTQPRTPTLLPQVKWLSPFLLACWDPVREEFQSVCRCMSGFSDQFYEAATQRLMATSIPGRDDSGLVKHCVQLLVRLLWQATH